MLKLISILFFSLIVSANFAKDYKMLKLKLSQIPESLDPLRGTNFQHFLILQCLYDNLINLTAVGDIESELAKSWKVSEDGKSYTFKIKENVFFHNNEVVKVEDIIFSLVRHLWSSTSSIVGFYLKNIVGAENLKDGEYPVGIKKISNSEIEIRLKQRQDSFLYVLTMPSFGIISKSEYNNSKKIIGSGSMVPTKKGDQLDLVPWSRYLGKKGDLDKIEITKTKNENENDNNFDILIGNSSRQKEFLKKGYVFDSLDSLTYVHAFYNTKLHLTDKNIRQILGMILQKIALDISIKNPDYIFNPHYFPKGILPKNYYQKHNYDFNLSDMIAKFKSEVKFESNFKKMKMVLPKSLLPGSFIENVNKYLGDLFHLTELSYLDLGDVLIKEDYDIFFGAYMGNFPDPDGFIEPLLPSPFGTYGVFPNKKLEIKISKINDLEMPTKRMSEYSKLFLSLENEYYFSGLFTVKIPILRRTTIKLPDSSYRYESELWKVFIKNDEKKI